MSYLTRILSAWRRAVATGFALALCGLPEVSAAQELCDLLRTSFDGVEEVCVTVEDCEFGVFGPESVLCDALCVFPQEDGSLGCRPDPFASGVVCERDEVLTDGLCMPCRFPFVIEDGKCFDPWPPDDAVDCGDGAVLRGNACIPCAPNEAAMFGECVAVGPPVAPEFQPLVAAGLDRKLATLLLSEAPEVLRRLGQLLRTEKPNFTDAQLDTAFFGASQILTSVECAGRSNGARCKTVPGVCVAPGVSRDQPTCVPTAEGASKLVSSILGMTRPLPPDDPCRQGLTPMCLTMEGVVSAGIDRGLAMLLTGRSPELLEQILAFTRDPRVLANLRASNPEADTPDELNRILEALLEELSQSLLFSECARRSEGQRCRTLPGMCVAPGLFTRDPTCVPTSEATIQFLSDSLGLPPAPDAAGMTTLLDALEERRQSPVLPGDLASDTRARGDQTARIQACLDDPGCDVNARGILGLIGTDELVPAETLQSLSLEDLRIAADARILIAEFEERRNARLRRGELELGFQQLDVAFIALLGSVVDSTRSLFEGNPPVLILIQTLADLFATEAVGTAPSIPFDVIAARTFESGLRDILRAVCLPTTRSQANACILRP